MVAVKGDNKFVHTIFTSNDVVEPSHLHKYAEINTSLGLTANPIVKFLGVFLGITRELSGLISHLTLIPGILQNFMPYLVVHLLT
ncbi:hypothetical protein ACJIZ3_020197 [Penstemon smallii]|uniref:Uncharacterized protein n=1 Tax=Penstemon smallii TaxID=265156 RepID=A0ABD3SI45_9LAMI